MPVEVCRIVASRERERDANPWLKARRETSEGEETIYRIEFQDIGTHALSDARSRLVKQLQGKGWTLSAVGATGPITIMTRQISE